MELISDAWYGFYAPNTNSQSFAEGLKEVSWKSS